MAKRYRWNDFAAFTERQISTQDMDPVYPVLRWIVDRSEEETSALWLVLLYLAYYNLPSGLAAWLATQGQPGPLPEWALKLPKATERRGHRDLAQLRRHLDHLTPRANLDWWRENWEDERQGEKRWLGLNQRTQMIYGNGRWAAYKMGDLAHYVLDWNTPAADLGMAYSSGPRHGMDLLFPPGINPQPGNSPAVIEWYESYGAYHLTRLKGKLGREITIDRLETALCDFHSLAKGRYYVGHDIDKLQDQTARIDTSRREENERAADLIYQARAATIDNKLLGELARWEGVSKPLCSVFRDEGLILTRPEWEDRQ